MSLFHFVHSQSHIIVIHSFSHVSHRLHLAENGLKEGLEKEISDTGRELSLAQTKLEQLLSDTNESTSEEKQNEEIANLSEEMDTNANALETAKSNLESMNDERISPDRKTNLTTLEDGIRQLFKGVSIGRLMKVIFVPLRTSGVANHARDVEFTFNICKDSKLKALRRSIIEMARKHYRYDENELKEEDVQLTDIFNKKVSIWVVNNGRVDHHSII
jgi:DNA repair exonuclease SbcCD ATPase subunit